MNKEEYVDNIVKSINLDIQRKDFLTYKEQDSWKDYLNDVIDRIVKQENKQLKEEIKQYQKELEKADSITQSCIFQGEEVSGISFRNCLNKMTDYKTRIDEAIEYINFIVLFNQNINGKFSETLWGEELLEILKGE